MVISLEQLLSLPMVWLLVVLLMLLIRRRVLQWARDKAGYGASKLDQRTASLLARLYIPVGLLAGGYFTMEILPLPYRWEQHLNKAFAVLAVLLAIWAAWRAFTNLLSHWGETNPNSATLVPPLQLVGGVLFTILAIALGLSGLGYSLTKVWTALGIGSVAIALALQDTLTNAFAGFHIMMDQPMRVGDYIKLDSGEEGRVIRIGWRSTRLYTVPNNIVVIPNSKLLHAAITNYVLPEPRLAVSIPVGVGHASDPRRVRAVLEEVARQAVGEVEGLVAEPPPKVRFAPGFGEYALHFTVICQASEFTKLAPVEDEMRYRIVERLMQEGIELGFKL